MSLGGNATTQGPDLDQIETEQLTLHAISGEDKLHLVTPPWPADNLPPSYASLLSIASKSGLVAAAGPDKLVVAKTESVRRVFREGEASGDARVKPFTPEATLSIPRVSHVAFSSDGSCLVIAAERGGGLAVYDTQAITNGGQEPAFQIATNGVAVRQLVPNPNPSAEVAHLFGVVLETGQLLLADLKARELKETVGGNAVFHENVTCASWSRLGKQIVAGKQDGTAVQIDQQGNVKAEIPVPPKVQEEGKGSAVPLASIWWLETNDFLMVHIPRSPASEDDGGMESDEYPPDPMFHLARRENAKSTAFTFQTIIDPSPAMPFGGRTPIHYFLDRLREWPPKIDELLFLISTAATDVGMITKSSAPLSPENPISGTLVTTSIPDTHRAAMPTSIEDSMNDTYPTGMAIDLSVQEKTSRPIPADNEVTESPTPLPALYVLNTEGVLKVWYVSYRESIRAGTAFPDLIAAGGPRPLEQKKDGTPTTPASGGLFGNSANTMPPPAKPQPATSSPAPASQPSFGAPSTPSFGGASAIGQKPSLWGTSSSTGPSPAKPLFGSSTPLGGGGGGSGFGQTGGMGAKASPWGTPAAMQTSTFGKPSTPFGGAAGVSQSPFAAAAQGADKKPTSSLFGGGAGASPFAAYSTSNSDNNAGQPKASPFASFAQPSTPAGDKTTSIFGQPSKPSVPNDDSFGSTATVGSSFGSGNTIGQSMFGSTSTFGKPSLPASREESMAGEGENKPTAGTSPFAGFKSGGLFGPPSGGENKGTAPVGGTESGGLFGGISSEQNKDAAPFGGVKSGEQGSGGLFGGSGFKLGSTFKGDGSAKDDLPKPAAGSASSFFGSGFGSALGSTGGQQQAGTPIKEEPGTGKQPGLRDIPAPSSSEPSKEMPKRFAGDLPPSDVPGGPMPKRLAGDLPPSDVPGGPMPKRTAGDLPPVDVPGDGEKKEDEPPLAGSPPVDLGNERFSEAAGSEDADEEVPAGPADESDEWDDEEEDGEGEAGEGEDEDEDEDEEGEEEESDHEVTDPKGLQSFMSRMKPASPTRPQHQQEGEPSTTPATERKPVPSFTPAGLPKAPIFAPPAQSSPRSPSPVRSVTAPMRQGAFGQPSRAAQPLQSTFGQPSRPSPPALGQSPQKPLAQPQPQRIAVPASRLSAEAARAPSPPKEPEAGSLEDEEDARIQEILVSDPEPTRELPSFLAHQDYVNNAPGREDVPVSGQIERVFRDVNSMLDTLGLNAHALRGFVEGQVRLKKEGERTEEDLEDEEGWTLDDGVDLGRIVDELSKRLENGKPENVQSGLHELAEEAQVTARLKTQMTELRRRIRAQTDPQLLAQAASAPLPPEMQIQQSELRQNVLRVQQLLAQTEENLTVLRADLATATASTRKPTNAPTMEAVTNTILKMTRMIEKKSGDIDVLESQIRRLPGGLAALKLDEDYEDQLVSSLAGSKLLNASTATPPRGGRRMLANGDAPGMGSMFGLSTRGTPPSGRTSMRRPVFSPEASRLGGSIYGTPGSQKRRKFGDVSEEEVKAWKAKTEHRRRVMEDLKREVESKGNREIAG